MMRAVLKTGISRPGIMTAILLMIGLLMIGLLMIGMLMIGMLLIGGPLRIVLVLWICLRLGMNLGQAVCLLPAFCIEAFDIRDSGGIVCFQFFVILSMHRMVVVMVQ